MYTNETLSKYIAKAKETEKALTGKVEKISISKGNRKIGHTLNVSLPPIITCSNCKECKHLCYDIKACMMYKNVIKSRINNLVLLKEDRKAYFDQIRETLKRRKKNKYFRWHVSGDIIDTDYFENMVQIAKEFPEFRFWTYTKNYYVVNAWTKTNGKKSIPENLSIMFSEWRGIPMINPYKFPEFKVVFKDEEKPKKVKWCCGNCNKCIAKNSHCVKGETVYCMEH